MRKTTILLVIEVVGARDAPKFGLGRTSAEYSAEGFGSVRFGHASTFGRTSAELRYIRFRFCTQICSLYCLRPESVLQELAFFAAITN